MANTREWEDGFEAGANGAHAGENPLSGEGRRRYLWEQGRKAGKATNNRYWAIREAKGREEVRAFADFPDRPRCSAPVLGGCPRPVQNGQGTLCSAHSKRKSRGGDLTEPIALRAG